MSGAGTPLRVFVVGSCVSRDTFEYLAPQAFTLHEYVARQSLVSAFGAPARPAVDLELLPSPFQRRMLAWDAASRLPGLLRESAADVDVVLWDLVDERLGLLEPPGGGVLTASVELRRAVADGLAAAPPEGPAFGSPRHLELFARALEQWRSLLDELDLRDRTLLLAPRWAGHTATGQEVPSSFGLSADDANALTEDYLRLIEDVVGVPVVGRHVAVTADADHRWGPAPFHYDAGTYGRLAGEIVGTLSVAGLLNEVAAGDRVEFVRDPVPGSHRDRAAAVPDRLRVTLSRTDDELVVEVFGSERRPCAFALYRGAERVAGTPYRRATAHRFGLPGPGTYRARVFVRGEDGERVPVSSRGLTLD